MQIFKIVNGQRINMIFKDPIQFSGGERHVQLPEDCLDDHDGEVYLTACVRSPEAFLDFCLIINAIWHLDDTVKVIAQVPYFPYARQDRVCAAGQAFSLEWAIASIYAGNPNISIITWDLHSDAMIDCFGKNVSQGRILFTPSKLKTTLRSSDPVLVQPDRGAHGRCLELWKTGWFSGIAVGDKVRDPKTGWITEYKLSGTDVKDRTCFIADDICDGGMTFNLLSDQLKAAGAGKVILFVTHGIFSKGLDGLSRSIDEVYTTNSLPQKELSGDRIINYDYFG